MTRADPRVSRFARRFVAIVPLACLPWSMAWAYTAAGDRIFPATLLLPQIAPSDEFYITGSTQPGRGTRTSNLSVLFDKTITERLGIAVTGGYNRIDNASASDGNGWLDPDFILQYEAILDPAHEFVLSAGVDRQFGGVGTRQAGADPVGATTPMVYFGKGFGDIAPDWLKPLAVSGFAGYQLADSSARSDQVTGGLAFGYSMPYRESKIASDTLPALLRNTTPMVEMLAATPNHGGSTTLTIAPGIAYAGQGWEFAVEALVPATEATGDGAGVIAQFHFGLDYLFPDSLGAPLIAGE